MNIERNEDRELKRGNMKKWLPEEIADFLSEIWSEYWAGFILAFATGWWIQGIYHNAVKALLAH